MEIAIASDIHDNLPNLKKFLDYIKKEGVKRLILCGDTGNKETLDFINKNFGGKIFSVLGNMDTWRKSEIRSTKSLPGRQAGETILKFKIDELKFAVTHFPDEAKKLALNRTEGCDFVFYGHTHKPWLEQVGKTILANSGNLAGIWYKATFAVLDAKTKKLSLKILDSL